VGVDDVVGPVEGISDLPGMVREPSVGQLPEGYAYGVTRYADLILRDAFPERCNDLAAVLGEFRIDVQEILKGGGSSGTPTRPGARSARSATRRSIPSAGCGRCWSGRRRRSGRAAPRKPLIRASADPRAYGRSPEVRISPPPSPATI